jgi:hypothetical protein
MYKKDPLVLKGEVIAKNPCSFRVITQFQSRVRGGGVGEGGGDARLYSGTRWNILARNGSDWFDLTWNHVVVCTVCWTCRGTR